MDLKNIELRIQKGFTLVELLIVVIILGILAAIAIPQFSTSTSDAKVSALDSNLSNFRAAIDLYYQQHAAYPSANASSGGAGCTADAGASAADTQAAFIEQLAHYTDSLGHTCKKKDPGFIYGPYMKKDTIPNNPVTGVNTTVVVSAGTLGMTADGAGGGWKFDNVTGQFIANDTPYETR